MTLYNLTSCPIRSILKVVSEDLILLKDWRKLMFLMIFGKLKDETYQHIGVDSPQVRYFARSQFCSTLSRRPFCPWTCIFCLCFSSSSHFDHRNPCTQTTPTILTTLDHWTKVDDEHHVLTKITNLWNKSTRGFLGHRFQVDHFANQFCRAKN